ncbi:MAG TPA: protein-disulfide reductase DsbD domain-containing protein [Pyrinomonadaceae bacterium]|jgi:DsbC/DsbD-like thiol-disulfide interchange protein|nr:protein-disulfide reductase DsbD domain-containing protein [Pyrinomonadaceae bacterium]
MENLTPYYLRLGGLVLVAFAAALSASCAGNSSTTNAPVNSANASVPANANAATNAPKSPLEGIVRASAENVEVRAGETAEASVRLAITSGYHVNANPATERFLIPTSLEVKPEAGIMVDKIVYPQPLKKKFAFAEVPLAVYEGDARITMTVRVPRDAAPGQRTLGARLRVQPCDDEKCYPPTTVETSLPVTVR